MREVTELMSRLLLTGLNSVRKDPQHLALRCTVNLTGFLVMICAYVLGCRVLYNYLVSQWSHDFSLLVISGVLVSTSLLLFIVASFLKPKNRSVSTIVSDAEKALSALPIDETVKKFTSTITPSTVAAVFILTALASYLSHHKKNI